MAKNNKNKAIAGAAIIAAAGLGIWYAIKSGLFGSSSKGGGNTYYYYTTSDGQQQSSNSWQNALIDAGSQIGVELIKLIQEISKGKQGAQAESDLKQVICDEYGIASTAYVSDDDVKRFADFVAANGRKPTQQEFETKIWI